MDAADGVEACVVERSHGVHTIVVETVFASPQARTAPTP
jgi:hypothetical protein